MATSSIEPPERLLELAQQNFASSSGQGAALQARLLALLRAGRNEEAYDSLPQGYQSIVASMVAALVQKKVGNELLARRQLKEAQKLISKYLPSPDGLEISPSSEDRPIYWCVNQILQREFDALGVAPSASP